MERGAAEDRGPMAARRPGDPSRDQTAQRPIRSRRSAPGREGKMNWHSFGDRATFAIDLRCAPGPRPGSGRGRPAVRFLGGYSALGQRPQPLRASRSGTASRPCRLVSAAAVALAGGILGPDLPRTTATGARPVPWRSPRLLLECLAGRIRRRRPGGRATRRGLALLVGAPRLACVPRGRALSRPVPAAAEGPVELSSGNRNCRECRPSFYFTVPAGLTYRDVATVAQPLYQGSPGTWTNLQPRRGAKTCSPFPTARPR